MSSKHCMNVSRCVNICSWNASQFFIMLWTSRLFWWVRRARRLNWEGGLILPQQSSWSRHWLPSHLLPPITSFWSLRYVPWNVYPVIIRPPSRRCWMEAPCDRPATTLIIASLPITVQFVVLGGLAENTTGRGPPWQGCSQILPCAEWREIQYSCQQVWSTC